MGFRDSSRRQRGDTIVEVLFSTAVGGLVIVLALAVMNRSIATAQMAVEHTMVRQSIDGQAETLRMLRGKKDALSGENTGTVWQQVLERANGNTEGSAFGVEHCSPSKPAHDFSLTTSSGSLDEVVNTTPEGSDDSGNPEVFATVGRGIWVEPVDGGAYVDFHIRACWEPPFSGPPATVGTIVRLSK